MTDFHLFVIIVAALFAKDMLSVAFKTIITSTYHRLDAERRTREFYEGRGKKPPPAAEGEGVSIVKRVPNASEL